MSPGVRSPRPFSFGTHFLKCTDLQTRLPQLIRPFFRPLRSLPVGPHGSILNKLADYTHKGGSKYADVMSMTWKKLEEKDENWRQCYKACSRRHICLDICCAKAHSNFLKNHFSTFFLKFSKKYGLQALLLLEYLVKAGPESVVAEAQRDSHLKLIKALGTSFAWKDAKGNDCGANVRHRATLLVQLLNSPEQLRLERDRAAKSRGKYDGLSSDQFDPPPPEPSDPLAFDVGRHRSIFEEIS